jgi:hypothetical protein
MTTDLTSLALFGSTPPDDAGLINDSQIIDPSREYNFIVCKIANLAPGYRQLVYLPPSVNFHPISVITDTLTDLLFEVCGDSYRNIVAGNGLFQTVTLAANYTALESPLTALRFTNNAVSGNMNITITM